MLYQAWLSTLAAGSLAWLTGFPWARHMAWLFLFEALSLTGLLVGIAQLFWISEHCPDIPSWCYQVSLSLLMISIFTPLAADLTGQVWLVAWGGIYFLGMMALFLISIAIRSGLAVWDWLTAGD